VVPDDLPPGNVSVISKFICEYKMTQKSLAILQIIGLQLILELERMWKEAVVTHVCLSVPPLLCSSDVPVLLAVSDII